MLHRSFVFAVFSILLAGCNSTLDTKHFTRDIAFNDAVDVYTRVGAKVLNQGYREQMNQRLIWQKAHDDQWFDTFITSHTKAGRLVSIDAEGNEAPLSVADLMAAMKRKEENAVALAQARVGSQTFLDEFNAANDEMRAMNASARQGTLDTQEAKANGQAIFEHVMTGLGAFTAGAATAFGI